MLNKCVRSFGRFRSWKVAEDSLRKCVGFRSFASVSTFSGNSAECFSYQKPHSMSAMGRTPVRRLSNAYPSHVVVPMPALSPTMEAGSIAQWLIKEGDEFSAGTAICEVETDKATVTYEATDEGVLAKILAGSGEIKVGQPMMITVEKKSDVAAFSSYVSAIKVSGSPIEKLTSPIISPLHQVRASAEETSETPQELEEKLLAQAALLVSRDGSLSSSGEGSSVSGGGGGVGEGGRVIASPNARRLVREKGLDMSLWAGLGTGPQGRIISADIAAFPLGRPLPQSASSVSTSIQSAAIVKAANLDSSSESKTDFSLDASSVLAGMYGYFGQPFEDFSLTSTSLSLAQKYVESKKNVPHYFLSVEINMQAVMDIRTKLNQEDLAVLGFMVKAAALACGKVPEVNATWRDSFVRRFNHVDINMVTGSGENIRFPVIRDVTRKGLSAINKEISDFDKAKGESVGTFTIHNLGMYGVKSAAPIILIPQAAALSLGAIVDTVIPSKSVAKGEDNWTVAPILVATLSCDHRVIDGAVGAQWLQTYKSLLENPLTMFL